MLLADGDIRKVNRIGRRVKEGAEELIRFTNSEIEKANAREA